MNRRFPPPTVAHQPGADAGTDAIVSVNAAGRLIVASPAALLLEGMALTERATVPEPLLSAVAEACTDNTSRALWFPSGGRLLHAVVTPTEPHGADIRLEDITVTLLQLPMHNPNPVIQVTLDGVVRFANPAATPVLRVWGGRLGHPIPSPALEEVRYAVEANRPVQMEVTVAEVTYDLQLIPVAAEGVVNLHAFDITKQKRAEKRLIEAYTQALEASRSKSVFLANMSHELRTPLNAIIGYAEMLIEEAPNGDLDRIHRSARHLLDLINTVLDLSKIEAGQMQVNPENFDVGVLIRDVADTMTPLVSPHTRFEVSPPDGPCQSYSDPTKLRQILLNLLSNAFKFTRQGTVALRVSASVTEVEFRIRDTGMGMTPEQATRVFDSFAQADDSTTRQFGGTGLGLTITKRFVELLGGTLEVTSVFGAGTTFIAKLPRDVRLGAAKEETPDRPNRPALVIDPIGTVAEQLRAVGIEQWSTASGAQGLQFARTRDPGVVIVVAPPDDLTGWAVLTALKSDPTTRHLAVAVVAEPDEREAALALGAALFAADPLDVEAFRLELQGLLAARRPRSIWIGIGDAPAGQAIARFFRQLGWKTCVSRNDATGVDVIDAFSPVVSIIEPALFPRTASRTSSQVTIDYGQVALQADASDLPWAVFEAVMAEMG